MSKTPESDSTNNNLPVAISGAKALANAGRTAIFDIGAKIREMNHLKMGSESIRTPELIEAIIIRLLHGEALLSITSDPKMPSHATILDWMRKDADLQKEIDWARTEGTHALFDSQLDIAAGGTFSTQDVVRDTLLVKAIHNVAAKRNRGAFGEKIDIRSTTINYSVTKDGADW